MIDKDFRDTTVRGIARLEANVDNLRSDVSELALHFRALQATIVTSQAEIASQRDMRHEVMDKRVRKVEQRQYWFAGFGAAIGAVFSAILSHKIT